MGMVPEPQKGALVSILLVYGLSRSGGAVTPVRLILVGVAVSAMFQAFTNYLVYTAPDDAAVREATFWMLGGLGSAKWEDLPLLALILPPLFLVLMALARPLNAMLMGDSSAVTLGVDLDRVRGVLILSSALLTASAVAVSGCIGFVGLVIPHLVRSVVGADHRRLIPLSALCGAVFMIWMDVGARLAVRPEEIPVGIITAFIGAPLFLWMIRVLRLTQLEEVREQSYTTLSGGEKQRVLIARALVQDTPCLILDEPTNHLDIKYQLQLMELVRVLGRTVVAAIHDLNLAALYCQRLYVMKAGRVAASGTPEEVLTPELLREIYEVEAEVARDSRGCLRIFFQPIRNEGEESI